MAKVQVQIPSEFNREVRQLIQDLGYLAHEYSWAHGMAYGRQVVEGPYEAKVQSGPGNPSQQDALDHQHLRASLQKASAKVSQVRSEVQAKTDLLRGAMAGDEKRHGVMFEPLRNPRVATNADLIEARTARSRRRSRGEFAG